MRGPSYWYNPTVLIVMSLSEKCKISKQHDNIIHHIICTESLTLSCSLNHQLFVKITLHLRV